ncbi:MAG: hypothetical protein UHJ46_04085 [Treponema sp.]|nr:hypothetical protein [Treponema sp.]
MKICKTPCAICDVDKNVQAEASLTQAGSFCVSDVQGGGAVVCGGG